MVAARSLLSPRLPTSMLRVLVPSGAAALAMLLLIGSPKDCPLPGAGVWGGGLMLVN